MTRFLGLIAGAALLALAGAPAQAANFLEGYLAECSAVSAGTCTEVATTGYARQPISFSEPSRGVTVNRVPFTFPITTATIAGHAVYDAASAGNLVAVIPLAASITTPPPDQGDVGALRITVAGMTSVGNAASYNAAIAPAGTLGTTSDGSTVTAGVAGTITRGVLTGSSYSLVVPVTGFTITPANSVSTLVLNPAGTLATGTITLPAAPSDNTFRLLCGQTVTTLTVSANSGQTLSGAVTTCTANAGHAWQYVPSASKWFTAY